MVWQETGVAALIARGQHLNTAGLSSCGLNCWTTALNNQTSCASSDNTCICADEPLGENFGYCLGSTCDSLDISSSLTWLDNRCLGATSGDTPTATTDGGSAATSASQLIGGGESTSAPTSGTTSSGDGGLVDGNINVHHGLSTGAKAGIAIGVLLAFALIGGLIIALIFILARRRRNRTTIVPANTTSAAAVGNAPTNDGMHAGNNHAGNNHHDGLTAAAVGAGALGAGAVAAGMGEKYSGHHNQAQQNPQTPMSANEKLSGQPVVPPPQAYPMHHEHQTAPVHYPEPQSGAGAVSPNLPYATTPSPAPMYNGNQYMTPQQQSHQSWQAPPQQQSHQSWQAPSQQQQYQAYVPPQQSAPPPGPPPVDQGIPGAYHNSGTPANNVHEAMDTPAQTPGAAVHSSPPAGPPPPLESNVVHEAPAGTTTTHATAPSELA